MQVGDLVINIHTKDLGIITDFAKYEHVIIDNKWLIPKEQLEVVCK